MTTSLTIFNALSNIHLFPENVAWNFETLFECSQTASQYLEAQNDVSRQPWYRWLTRHIIPRVARYRTCIVWKKYCTYLFASTSRGADNRSLSWKKSSGIFRNLWFRESSRETITVVVIKRVDSPRESRVKQFLYSRHTQRFTTSGDTRAGLRDRF